jgi:hypothetical protein
VKECPHCHTRVRPRADRTCPSCGGSFDDRTAAKSPYTRLTLLQHEKLPPICCRCAAPTERTMELGSEQTVGGEKWWMRILAVLGMIVAAFFFRGVVRAAGQTPLGSGETTRITRRLPVCDACAKSDPPKLDHVDFRAEDVTVFVHRKFAKVVAKARRERREERQREADLLDR